MRSQHHELLVCRWLVSDLARLHRRCSSASLSQSRPFTSSSSRTHARIREGMWKNEANEEAKAMQWLQTFCRTASWMTLWIIYIRAAYMCQDRELLLVGYSSWNTETTEATMAIVLLLRLLVTILCLVDWHWVMHKISGNRKHQHVLRTIRHWSDWTDSWADFSSQGCVV